MLSTPRRKTGRRACNGYSILKVKYSKVSLTQAALPTASSAPSINVRATVAPAFSGPRRCLRQASQESRRQGHSEDSTGADFLEGSSAGENSHSERRKTPVSLLTVRLYFYNHRLFPVWPILSIDNVAGMVLHDPASLETFVLADALYVAIIAQLKLPFEGRTDDDDPATTTSTAAGCQRAKASLQGGYGEPVINLNMLRASFFQHNYHGNPSPGGSKTLPFLGDAWQIAQIIGLRQQSTYTPLPEGEQQMRGRIL